ncbi:MAG: sigma-54 dependent transcriptional regulator [Proteobacteria bacterium]|nr:sigma-54 dependent transcriptional regulator [Pseudomonadota bacterium]
MKRKKILIIDDEHSLLESLDMFLTEKGYTVQCATTAAEGFEKSDVFNPDATILDIRLPDMDGLEVLKKLRSNNKQNIIIITAFHDMDTTIKAVKSGAFEYIPKPIDVEELEKAIERAMKYSNPAHSTDAKAPPPFVYEEGKIIGKSRVMKEIFKTIGVLSENRVTVLIEGETGTGKESIARAVHYHSPFRNHPLRIINCSAIVGTLLESELFGHEQGSFTGASYTKKGKFELAGEGTIFLDEVGEIPFELQSKLLRFLQEKEFERIGGEKKIKSNARVIAATNRDLWKMVQDGNFREDLYYRLSVATIKVPPLRERKPDIPLLIEYMLKKINHELKKGIKRVEQEAARWMLEYDWPGNVRELENVLTHAAINTQGEVILEELIIPLLGKRVTKEANGKEVSQEQSLQNIEKEYILKILDRTHWHLGKTCKLLDISRPTLRNKLRTYGISPNGKSI